MDRNLGPEVRARKHVKGQDPRKQMHARTNRNQETS